MENRILDDSYATSNQSGLSGTDADYLLTAAKWARFLGILGFVMAALVAVAAFFITSILSMTMPLGAGTGAGVFAGLGTFMTMIYLGIAAFQFFIALYMYNFGTKTKMALASNDSETLTEGFKNLKSLFKLMGIVAAVFLGFYAVLFVIGIFVSLFAR